MIRSPFKKALFFSIALLTLQGSAQAYQVTVFRLTGESFTIEILTTDTIGEIKTKIKEKTKLADIRLMLIDSITLLTKDNSTAGQCSIVSGSKLYLVTDFVLQK